MNQQAQPNVTDKIGGLFKGNNWAQVTANIFMGVLIYQIGGILYGLLDAINTVSTGIGHLQSLADRGTFDFSIGVLDVLVWVVGIGVICGYVIFLMGLGQWKPMLKEGDAKAVGQIWLGVILGLAATVFDMIPWFGWFAGLIYIASFILMLLGYNALKSSVTFPEPGKSGANKLFIAMILMLVGAVIGFIPIVGDFIEIVLDIVAFFMVLAGWKAIKNTPAPAN